MKEYYTICAVAGIGIAVIVLWIRVFMLNKRVDRIENTMLNILHDINKHNYEKAKQCIKLYMQKETLTNDERAQMQIAAAVISRYEEVYTAGASTV
jgi:ABC-type lipoprotein release transport system permease subunit